MYSHPCSERRNRTLWTGLLCLTLTTVAATTPSLHADQRRRIAVMSLDVSPDAKQKAALQLHMQNDLGATLADLLVTRLVTDGKFTVIERAALDKIIKEQNFSNSDRADQATAVKLGKLAGVDAIVIGSVTQFGGEQEKKTIGLGGFSNRLGPLGNTSTSKSTVTVGVTARLIDVTTGAILASATGTGTSTKSTTSTNSTLVSSDTSGQAFTTPAVSDATNQAITQVVAQIEAAPLPTVAPPPPVVRTAYKGVIADVSGTTLILTVGTNGGVKVGDTIEVSRPTRTVKDPTTGAVLRVISEKLGEAKITEADSTSSVAIYSGTAVVKVKDQISSQP